MKRTGILAAISALFRGKENQNATSQPKSPEEAPGVCLRQMVLTTPVQDLGFAADDDFPTVYGVLTEWDLDGIKVTVMSMRDGTASLYTTSNFGIVGGQAHERVRQSALRYVKTAEQFAKAGKPVTEFAYPKSGQVFYYLLTYDGVRLAIGDQAAIERGPGPTFPLFAAAQEVLSELRMITES